MIKVAFFDAKAYDKPSFEHYGSEHDMQFRFLETKLNDFCNPSISCAISISGFSFSGGGVTVLRSVTA